MRMHVLALLKCDVTSSHFGDGALRKSVTWRVKKKRDVATAPGQPRHCSPALDRGGALSLTQSPNYEVITS